ncbi:MAG TPA: RloB family protein [Noviherbaspirillum sp.]
MFCVIDRDTHESFDEAIELAKTVSKITVISSYPCFEFWYLLHFGYNRKPYAAAGNKSAGDQVVSALHACEGMNKYVKGGGKSVFDMLFPRLDVARQVSPNVLDQALKEGSLNPSTRVHELIDYFEQLGQPQPK